MSKPYDFETAWQCGAYSDGRHVYTIKDSKGREVAETRVRAKAKLIVAALNAYEKEPAR